MNKKAWKFAQSIIAIPFIATSFMPTAYSSIEEAAPQNQQKTSKEVKEEVLLEDRSLTEERAEKIDVFFANRSMPLEGYGEEMIKAADKYGIDWALLPAIAIRESSGGKNTCQTNSNNPFGWGSCKIGFDSLEEAIDTIAWNLAGQNPNTAAHYDGKSTEEKIKSYNPPSVIPTYYIEVMEIMDRIKAQKI